MFDTFGDVDYLTLFKYEWTVFLHAAWVPCLFDEPMDLSFCPFLLVARIYLDIFSLMFFGVIQLAADYSVAASTTSPTVHDNVLTELLCAIHDQAMDNGKLPAM